MLSRARRAAHITERFPNRSEWQHPTSEVHAEASFLYRGFVDIHVQFPAPGDAREGILVAISPEAARHLAAKLLLAADAAQREEA